MRLSEETMKIVNEAAKRVKDKPVRYFCRYDYAYDAFGNVVDVRDNLDDLSHLPDYAQVDAIRHFSDVREQATKELAKSMELCNKAEQEFNQCMRAAEACLPRQRRPITFDVRRNPTEAMPNIEDQYRNLAQQLLGRELELAHLPLPHLRLGRL